MATVLKSDNTFATAKDLGTFSKGSRALRASNSIGPSDPIDVYRFTVKPGRSFRYRDIEEYKGGNFRFSFYFKNPTSQKIELLTRQTARPGKYNTVLRFPDTRSAPSAVRCYFVFDRPTRNVQYKFTLDPLG